eukprot:gene12910-17300_t
MGCTPSKPAPVNRRLSKRPNKESVEHNLLQLEQIQEERKLRLEHERELEKQQEREFHQKLYEEKERLRVVALSVIERRISCEDLMDTLSNQELKDIREHPSPHIIQKQLRYHRSKNKHDGIMEWIIYNNLKALDEKELAEVGFLIKAMIHKVQELMLFRDDTTLTDDSQSMSMSMSVSVSSKFPTPKKHLQNPTLSFIETSTKAAKKPPPPLIVEPLPIMQTDDSNHISRKFLTSNNLLKLKLLSLPLLSLIPIHFHQISNDNIYDFDIPAGMVTAGVAKVIIDLYKNNGRLSFGSVQKLLRLSYKLLSQLPNITYIDLAMNDRVTVVGDLH